jgi:hypothetical protein
MNAQLVSAKFPVVDRRLGVLHTRLKISLAMLFSIAMVVIGGSL